MRREQVGHGQATFQGEDGAGRVHEITSIDEVLRCLERGDSGWIALVHDASATNIAPLFPKLGGVICTRGGKTSHLALTAAEFGIPCVMGAKLTPGVRLDGEQVVFTPAGDVFVIHEERQDASA